MPLNTICFLRRLLSQTKPSTPAVDQYAEHTYWISVLLSSSSCLANFSFVYKCLSEIRQLKTDTSTPKVLFQPHAYTLVLHHSPLCGS